MDRLLGARDIRPPARDVHRYAARNGEAAARIVYWGECAAHIREQHDGRTQNHIAADREHISETTGYKRSSRDAYIQRLQARQLLEKGGGAVRATDVLFEG
jgi:hypothetical protein